MEIVITLNTDDADDIAALGRLFGPAAPATSKTPPTPAPAAEVVPAVGEPAKKPRRRRATKKAEEPAPAPEAAAEMTAAPESAPDPLAAVVPIQDAPAAPAAPAVDRAAVVAKVRELAGAGKREQVSSLILGLGFQALADVPEDRFGEFMTKMEAL